MAPSKRSAALVAAMLAAPAAYVGAQNVQTSTYTDGSYNAVQGGPAKPQVAYPGYLAQKGDGTYQFLANAQVIKGDNNHGQTNVGIQTTDGSDKPGKPGAPGRKMLGEPIKAPQGPQPQPPKTTGPPPLKPGYLVSVNGQSGDAGKGGNIWQFQSADSYVSPGNFGVTNKATQTNTNSGNGGASGDGVAVDASTKSSYNQNGRRLSSWGGPQGPTTVGYGGSGGAAGSASQGSYSPQFLTGSGNGYISNSVGQSTSNSNNGGFGGQGVYQPAPQGGYGPSGRKLSQWGSTTAGFGGAGGNAGSASQSSYSPQFLVGAGNGYISNSAGQSTSNSNNGGFGGQGVFQPAPQGGRPSGRKLQQLLAGLGGGPGAGAGGRPAGPAPPQNTFGAGGPGGAGGNSGQANYSPQFVVGANNQGVFNQAGQSTSDSNNGGFGGNGATQYGQGRKLSQWGQTTAGFGGAGGFGGSSSQSSYSPQFLVGSGNSDISNSVGQDISASGNGGFGGDGVTQPQQPRQ